MRHAYLDQKLPAIPLPTAAQYREALTIKQCRRVVPAGKRHGRGFALGLSIYSGICASARLDLRDMEHQPQGDHAERNRGIVVSAVREQWQSIAPPRARR
jgi:hypothetical protein